MWYVFCRLMIFFFFSSRRRHTRWNCDWSSDVCSSDLGTEAWVSARYPATASSTKGIMLLGSVPSPPKKPKSSISTQSARGANATDNTLMAVSGTQATGLWAVGYQLSPTGLKPLVLRYDTTLQSPSWVSVSGAGGVPSPGQVDTVLTGVDVRSASDVWAVGYYSDGSVDRPLALHWDGSTWSNSPIPGAGLLREVSVVGPGNVWAAGTYYNPSLLMYQTLVVHFDGTAWTTAVSANAAHAGDEIIGMETDPAGSLLTVVGAQGPNPLTEMASCPSGPVSLAARTEAPVPPVPTAPGVGPTPKPPPPTLPAATPVPVTITDQAAAAGIGGTQDWSFSAAVADVNGDGWPDLFVSHHWHPANLWLNNQNSTFSPADVSYFSSITDRHGCHTSDFNQDSLKDIFCSVGADRGTHVKSNALYIQQPGGTFTDQAYQWNLSDPTSRGRFDTVLDVNHDGYPDIFYGAESLRPDGLPSIDRLYMNTGQSSFLDSPAMGLDLNIGAHCAHTVDYNSNGWKDLLVCGESGGLHLFENMQGTGFKDVSSILGAPVNDFDAAMVDVNRDNNPDIYVVCGKTGTTNAPDSLLLGNATGGFTTTAIPETTVGAGEEAYPIDYTNDGLTSFLVLNGETPITGPIQLLTPQPATAGTLPGRSVFSRPAGP